MSQARVYCKTEAGLDEVLRRHTGLNARVRQLLILVDGKRSVAELSRLMALVEFEEFLALLELKGLISPKVLNDAEVFEGTVSLAKNADMTHVDASYPDTIYRDAKNAGAKSSNLDSGTSSAELGANEDSKSLRVRQVESAVALARQPSLPANVSAKSSENVRLDVDRLNMARLLQETVGPLAEDLCHRIARASRRAELSELFVASLTVVELMSGRKAADRFVEKMKQMGWEV